MNFEQALHTMAQGSRVRLSDWSGYWFIDPASSPVTVNKDETATYDPYIVLYRNIRVFTRDGDILDCPNIDRYKDRDDWEVVTENGWSFEAALRFLKNGKCVTKRGWEIAGIYIKLLPSREQSIGYNIYTSGPCILLYSPSSIPIEWVPKTIDLFFNDWQIVNA